MATIEKTFTVIVLAGETSGHANVKLPAGEILGCFIYPSPTTNPGIIRASIKNEAGEPISELQHIDNYRARDCKYEESFKPLEIESGNTYDLDIKAKESMPEDYSADFIFVYKKQTNCVI